MTQSKEGFLWTPQNTTEGLETESVVQSSKTIQSSYDAVVIGSGFAGLIAARNLAQDSALRVLLVEARDRIGGRTWTAKAFGEEFEMGGTWVHWNQPHLYHELHRYGLHRYLKTSAGTIAPEKCYFKPTKVPVQDIPPEGSVAALERAAAKFFSIDGMDSRTLMPFPHDPFREPAVWRKYDHLTVKQRLDQLDGLSQFEKEIFESNVATFGSAPGKDIGFSEALRWFALGGHSMASVFERAGIYKLGNGGMTAFASAILRDFKGDMLFNTAVEKIDQGRQGVSLHMKDGRRIDAKAVVSTVPL